MASRSVETRLSLPRLVGADDEGSGVGQVAAVPGPVGIGLGAEAGCGRIARADPLDHDLPRDDLPLAGASLQAVDVPAAGHVDDRLVLAEERADAVRLRMCDVAVELDGVRGQVVLMGAPVGRVQLVRPGDELGGVTEEVPVMVERAQW